MDLSLLLSDSLTHLRNHLLQQYFAFFLRLGVGRMHLAFAAGVGGGGSALRRDGR